MLEIHSEKSEEITHLQKLTRKVVNKRKEMAVKKFDECSSEEICF